jgi:hypothetical protein
MDPDDALDQDRLAGTVVAGERGDLAGWHIEVDAHERLHRPEVLVDPAQAQEGLDRADRLDRWPLRANVG